MAHFAIACGFYYTFVHMYLAEWISVIIVIFIDVVWQIKDGLVPIDGGREIWKYLGGDGFSYRNLVYDMSGLVLGLAIDLAVPPHVRGTVTPEEAVAIQNGATISENGSVIDSFNQIHLTAHNNYRSDH